MRFLLALLLSASLSSAALAQGSAQGGPKEGPEALLRFIYQHYIKDVPFRWSGKAMADRLFEPVLARALVRLVNSPANQEGPVIDFDPFVEAQDFQIASVDYQTESQSAERARLVAVFTNMGEPRRVTYDLVATKAGWRIHDISWGQGSGSFRGIVKVR